MENFDAIHSIAAEISGGRIPVICSRGNHDLRGLCAEKLADYMPNAEGKTYYTFRVGGVWGLVLDCAEDKPDDHEEYGHMICCHAFRKRETEFIKSVIAKGEYNEQGIENKVVIVHNPFTHKLKPPFDIEGEVYTEWARLVEDNIKPDLMICGHTHKVGIYERGCEFDDYGQPCTLVVAAEVSGEHYAGCGFTFDKDSITVICTNGNGETVSENKLSK